MAIKDKVSGAYQDIETLKVPVSGAYQEADHANALVNGAWQEVWSGLKYICPCRLFGNTGNGSLTVNGSSANVSFYYANAGLEIKVPNYALAKGQTVTIEFTLDNANCGKFVLDGSISTDLIYEIGNATPVVGKNTLTFTTTRAFKHIELQFENSSIKQRNFIISDVKVDGVRCELTV